MNKKTLRITALCAVIVMILTAFYGCGGKSTLKNASFESGSGVKIDDWSQYNYEKSVGDDTSGEISIVSEGYRGKCVKIENRVLNDCRIYQEISVSKKSSYKVTLLIKIDGTIDEPYLSEGTQGAGFNISSIDGSFRTGGIYTTGNEWKQITAYLKTGDDQKTAKLSFGIGGYSAESVGTVYIDEISLEKVQSIPEGESVISVEPYKSSSEEETKDANPFFKILFVSLVVALSVYIVLLLKKHDQELYAKKLPLSDSPVRLKRADAIIVAVLTLTCSLFSFYKLGDAHGAESFWKPQAQGEYVTVEFDSVKTVARTTYLPNIPSSYTSSFTVEYEKDEGSGIFEKAFTFSRSDSDAPEFFEWKIESKSFKAKRVRIRCNNKGMPINEMAFWESADGGYSLIPVKVIDTYYDSELNKSDTPDKLFDEQKYAQAYRTYENGTYFDEIYFPRTAYEHINGLPIYETTHPPLGKTFISLGIRIFGMNPFGWRFSGTLFGVLIVPLMYLFALKILKKREYATFAAFLIEFDFMRTAQTRLATIDTYSVFFILLMYYFMFDYFTERSYEKPFLRQMAPLALSGIAFGLGAASKWTSIYAGLGLAILFFAAKFCEADDMGKGRYKAKGKLGWFTGNFVPTCLMCVIFFIAVPGLIYLLSYIPYMASNPDKSLWQVMMENQKYMYSYHSGLNATHPYQSSWYSWIIDMRPIYYYSSSSAGLPSGMRASVASFGNPAVWWVGLACIPVSLFYSWKNRAKEMIPVFLGYACQLFPWIMVTRCTFIYHYFTAVPFMVIMIAYTVKCLRQDKVIGRPTIFVYMAIVLALYIAFYPVLVGIPVKSTYIDDLRWFGSWSF